MPRFTDIKGFLIGHATHPSEATGCTVILCPEGAVAGVDVRGSAPGTRETDLLRPGYMIREVHGVVLSGGSAFGLRTADGVVQFLHQHGFGYDARGIRVPIVPAAVIFDLRPGRSVLLPSVEMGYQACQNASSRYEEGLVGAGRGATVGKVLGLEQAMAGGFATATLTLPGKVLVSAAVVVNALGDVVDPSTGKIVAGARKRRGRGFADSFEVLKKGLTASPLAPTNTTLAVVATNARLDKEQANKLAWMAQNGIARATRPAHTMHDGDVVFALSRGDRTADVSVLGEAAAQAVSAAIVRAVQLTNDLD
ncbi:MAG: peptidase S58 family protein [Calditrichaeota bacterium]|nr:MAG: peptidase S58 family protein [Calditrichota bacterium]